jgi:hypothetical protein
MPRRSPYLWTAKKVLTRLRKGYGRGVGANYRPWLSVHDFSSSGRTHRTAGIKIDRVHQLFSDGEFRAFVLFEWDDRVIDIREQYPLDRDDTYRIAHHLGYRHPLTVDGMPNVMTTDFLLTLVDGREIARAYKPANKLAHRRVAERLRIESEYWRERGIHWGVTTEEDINRTEFDHINTVRPFYDLTGVCEPYPGALAELCEQILNVYAEVTDRNIQQICKILAATDPEYTPALVMSAARHLIARKILVTDMRDPRPLLDRPLRDFRLYAPWGALNGN